MISITRDLRKDLEKTVKQARRVAEAGARQAVQQLRVGDGDAPKDLTTDQRALRTRLRAHGRQLGDRRDAKTGVQETAHLIQECAYEHWHRMLFARFLAETDLLIEPDSGVAITLDEVQELAREKATDWLELASEYAERMLPQIFRKDDPVLQIILPPETRSEIEDLLKGLSKPVFEADDSLGWVYQFWQADKKEEVNKSETKIGADELPAVTQLFTEDYMVLFLLHNTLGAWWAGKVLADNPSLATSAADEAALRSACKAGDIDWGYLRFVREKGADGADGSWRPAAGAFESWPKSAKQLTVLDPCMGSGHFLVFAFPILVAFRMAEESLSQSAAVDAVLSENLFGLEIDPRCTQIAAFNLGFAAWRKVGYRRLPRLNLACSGLAIGVTKAEWLKLAEKAVTAADPAAKRDLLGVEKNLLTVGLEERVKNGLEALYDLFSKAPWLGSLIEPRRAGGDIFREGFEKLEPLLASILAAADTDDAREIAVAAQGMAKAAELLARRFTLVATNVPYLGRGKQDEILRLHCENNFPNSKADIALCMLERCIQLCSSSGTVALVSPQSWLFLNTYKKLRNLLLRSATWNAVVRLGPAAFQDMNWWAATTQLAIITNNTPSFGTSIAGSDVSSPRDPAEKARQLVDSIIQVARQSTQLQNPDSRISLGDKSQGDLLEKYAGAYQGIGTSDNSQFLLRFWEIESVSNDWRYVQCAPEKPDLMGGLNHVLLWEHGAGRYYRHAMALKAEGRLGGWKSGGEAWGKPGLTVKVTGNRYTNIYMGDMFDTTVAAVIPADPDNIAAIYVYITSDEYDQELSSIDQAVSITEHTLLKVPFDLARWKTLASEKFPDGLPKPSTADPTQSFFGGHPKGSDQPLHVATARLLGYNWPRLTGSSFSDCDQIASDGLETYADTDGIVCLSATKGLAPAEGRLHEVLGTAFGQEWSAAKLARLLSDAGFAGKTLDDWLRDGFMQQHCELFQQCPFIWHVWDGRRDGFHALINYHRLAAPNGEGRRTLEKLIYTYVGDWIDQQRADQKAGIEGADARLAHSEHLRSELINILEGESPYDIFVRWKALYEQSLGWNPDINDGVKINIRPFITARLLNARVGNASILRNAPKIKWDKDRGKEPARDKADFPWFWSWDASTADFVGGAKFDGSRWNDLHYSRAAKEAARDRQGQSGGGNI